MTSQKGQTLLEILLAFSVSILVLSAVILGIVTSLSNTQYTKNQGLANSYAQEGMAVIRQLRDSGWNNFLTKDEINYCLDQNTEWTESSSCVQNIGKIFSRAVRIEHNTSDCSVEAPPTPTPTPILVPKGSKVTVTVSWADSKCPLGNPLCHNVKLVTCFSNIDQKLAP